MKIAMIGHKRIPSREGGIEIVVEELASKMVAEGHEVYAYNRAGHHVSGAENDIQVGKMYKGIHLITVPTSQKKSLNATIYSVLATLHAVFHHYDVIHYHASGSCAMLWLPHLLGIHTVATIHGIDSQRAKWGGFATRYLEFGEKCAAKYADELIVLSEGNKKFFKDKYGREATLIPNGIGKPEILEAQEITEQFGLKKDEYILFLARIVPEKGLHYLIKAYKQIHTDKKLVIVGGTSHSNDYVSKIKRAAREDDRIMLLGFQQGKVLEELYSNAYLYVLPSDVEGMPISLLEAMSYGNCCLVSDINETAGVVADKGITFKKGDVDDLKEKLIQLLDNKTEVCAYKEQAADYVLGKYNWDDVVTRTIELYKCGLKAL
ncbi:Glycosyltransferase involved in cell wall bisynthesis [Pseudobutyrivibrio sp. UC1225]|uniref:glycosyltransferase family 4 protein n=1 Tax=Pseudobutyrivibrio sp. UC1225 TaxID=1798185 RepID=UPI0008EBF032|nr:glycosyltransferase family 4 protein [Pseudobutyrivibrio sp. UC1225]SFO24631.1 Glycosyltransferase involved in cell wall bisynthesis [Pseudobutyrivibrio sp. UC1225]